MDSVVKNKGVILAGGRGTRLRPLTDVTNKILLPIFDRPMIASPIDTLKSIGINDICVVTSRDHLSGFMNYLGDGSAFGVKFTYVIQDKPLGISHALLQAEDFFKDGKVVVILGDNIFEHISVPKEFLEDRNAYVFVKEVSDPKCFGVAELDKNGNVMDIEEKPKHPKTSYAVPGLYAYPPGVFDVIRGLRPSARGELEITDLNNHYINEKKMKALKVKGYWLDTGSFESMMKASILRSMDVSPNLLGKLDRNELKNMLTDI